MYILIGLHQIQEAQARLQGVINRTHLDYSATFSRISGHQVYIKPENLQKTGSFKVRGATNFALQLSPEQGSRGLITPSSGNHSQGVAYAAKLAGYSAVVVLPDNAPAAKVAAVKGYGAEVVFSPNATKMEKAQQIAAERGMNLVHPYNDYNVIAGQGTIGLEILEDLPDVDIVLAPIGGGSLISGVSTAIKESRPQAKVIGVEPVGSNSMYLSIQAGEPVSLPNPDTIADGVRNIRPGEVTVATVQKYVDDIVLVTEEEIKLALIALLERGKILAEPAGAVSLAAVLAGKVAGQGKKVAAIISGGNIDFKLLADLINTVSFS
ncbi:MAG: threonine ammonia-lyase [bacterium]